MAEYIERESYCRNLCRCNEQYCDKTKCPIWKSPKADVEPVRHGKWITATSWSSLSYGMYECSECHGIDNDCSDYYGTHSVKEQEWCPWCGAKMDGGDENG